MINKIGTAVNPAVGNPFQNADFYTEVKQAIHKCISAPELVDGDAAVNIDASTLIVPMAMFVQHEVEKNSVEKAKIAARYITLDGAVYDNRIKVEDGVPTLKINSARSPNHDGYME